jgi:hypothetical protein
MADLNIDPELADTEKARGNGPQENDRDVKPTEYMSPNGSNAENAQTEMKEDEKPKPSKLKELWAKLGLDAGTLVMMIKLVSEAQLLRIIF